MFLRYAYQKVNGKQVLFLYKTTKFEFAKENTSTSIPDSIKTLEEEAISYIQKKKLPTSFDSIYILVDGNIVKTISREQFQIEERKLYKNHKEDAYIKVLIQEKEKTKESNLLTYLVGVLFTNCTFPMHKEALKALTILYRTYALENLQKKGYIPANNSFAIYRDPLFYKFTYLDSFYKIYNLLREVVLETQGLYLLSNGKPVKPYIHLVSSGYTNTNGKDTYLVCRESLWDMKAENYFQKFFFSYQELQQKLHLEEEKIRIKLLNSTTYQIGKKQFSPKVLSYLLNLPSQNFTCIEEKEGITFLCRGVGDNLGLSMFGANYLAEQGLTYSQILSYYFQNILLYHL